MNENTQKKLHAVTCIIIRGYRNQPELVMQLARYMLCNSYIAREALARTFLAYLKPGVTGGVAGRAWFFFEFSSPMHTAPTHTVRMGRIPSLLDRRDTQT